MALAVLGNGWIDDPGGALHPEGLWGSVDPTAESSPSQPTHNPHTGFQHSLAGLGGPGEAGTCCLGPHSSFFIHLELFTGAGTPQEWGQQRQRAPEADSSQDPRAVWFLSEHSPDLPLFFYRQKARAGWFLQGPPSLTGSCVPAATSGWCPALQAVPSLGSVPPMPEPAGTNPKRRSGEAGLERRENTRVKSCMREGLVESSQAE